MVSEFKIRAIIALKETGERLISKAEELRQSLRKVNLERYSEPISPGINLYARRIDTIRFLRLEIDSFKYLVRTIDEDAPNTTTHAHPDLAICRYLLKSEKIFRSWAVFFASLATLY